MWVDDIFRVRKGCFVMSKLKGLLKVLVILLLAFSTTGFICDEEDEPIARILNNSSGCTINSAQYGSTTWTGPWSIGEYSEYKQISGSHQFCLDADNTAGLECDPNILGAPEKDKTYTIKVWDTNGNCDGVYSYIITED